VQHVLRRVQLQDAEQQVGVVRREERDRAGDREAGEPDREVDEADDGRESPVR
jgi:hypothetical protein